jgi:CelD/BcsL family acetyltransferase involved in cellulose biosynthesis
LAADKTRLKENQMNQIASRFVTTSEVSEWRALVPATRSFFGSVEFARIAGDQAGYTAQLLVIEAGTARVAIPFFLRPIAGLKFAGAGDRRSDALTPEFTGPIILRSDPFFGRNEFHAAVGEIFRERGIVAEFMHLNPWSEGNSLLDPALVCYNRDIVWVDLSIGPERLWTEHFAHACRKNIKRAERERIRVFEADSVDHIREFHRIYIDTMIRTNALSQYHFPLEYFLRFFGEMRNHARFTMAERNGQIIGAILYTHDDDNIYSYLGGADAEFQEMRPTNAMVYDTIRWGAAHGKKRLILGGGYRPDDGIFRFKSGFSKYVARFSTYREIHLFEDYRALETQWCEHYYCDQLETEYFPSYRWIPSGQSQHISSSEDK